MDATAMLRKSSSRRNPERAPPRAGGVGVECAVKKYSDLGKSKLSLSLTPLMQIQAPSTPTSRTQGRPSTAATSSMPKMVEACRSRDELTSNKRPPCFLASS